jgi:hypothetical protein
MLDPAVEQTLRIAAGQWPCEQLQRYRNLMNPDAIDSENGKP